MTPRTVHVVDGTFELFRCFHGAPRATDEEGREIGAARGLAWTLGKLLRTQDVEAVVVAFDAMARPRRADGSADAALRSQGALAVEVARALGLPTWTAARGQADDVMASAAAAWRDRARIVLCTADKDLHQCVREDRVVVLDRIRDRVTDEDEVRRRYGVAPPQLPDLVGLIGDPSDGLPGIPGWGPKSGAAVIAAHGRLEDVPDDPAAWGARVRGADRLAASLRELRRDALVVRDLATLRSDLPIRVDPADVAWRGPTPALPALLRRLGAEELLEKLPPTPRSGCP